jgi:hypothetical protein
MSFGAYDHIHMGQKIIVENNFLTTSIWNSSMGGGGGGGGGVGGLNFFGFKF